MTALRWEQINNYTTEFEDVSELPVNRSGLSYQMLSIDKRAILQQHILHLYSRQLISDGVFAVCRRVLRAIEDRGLFEIAVFSLDSEGGFIFQFKVESSKKTYTFRVKHDNSCAVAYSSSPGIGGSIPVQSNQIEEAIKLIGRSLGR